MGKTSKSCGIWDVPALALESEDASAIAVRGYLSRGGGSLNFWWLYANGRFALDRSVDDREMRKAAYAQRSIKSRGPNWARYLTLKRLYEKYSSECSDPFVLEVDKWNGVVKLPTMFVRRDLRTGKHSLVVPQPRQGLDFKEDGWRLVAYIIRAHLMSKVRELLLPELAESEIPFEIPDLGDTRKKSLRGASLRLSDAIAPLETAAAEMRLQNLINVWPREISAWRVRRRVEKLARRGHEPPSKDGLFKGDPD
jgi:hypothetical protein